MIIPNPYRSQTGSGGWDIILRATLFSATAISLKTAGILSCLTRIPTHVQTDFFKDRTDYPVFQYPLFCGSSSGSGYYRSFGYHRPDKRQEDACILSHWRAIALLKHLDLKMPLKCVEEMGWKIQAGERLLQFIFTPYLHFPGAFCTFDPATGSLFSSDLMGGFTEGFALYAKDRSYLESIRLFHEHYMPSREILASAVKKIESLR